MSLLYLTSIVDVTLSLQIGKISDCRFIRYVRPLCTIDWRLRSSDSCICSTKSDLRTGMAVDPTMSCENNNFTRKVPDRVTRRIMHVLSRPALFVCCRSTSVLSPQVQHQQRHFAGPGRAIVSLLWTRKIWLKKKAKSNQSTPALLP